MNINENKINIELINKLIKKNNKSNLAKLLGIKITDLSYGYARATLTIDKRHLNWLDTVHGGAVWSLADHTAGALGSVMEKGAVNIQTSFNFLSKVEQGQTLISEARLIKETSKTTVVEIKVETEDQKTIGVGIVTGMKL